MSIKSILCIFGGAPHELNALNTAMVLAQSHSAQIRAVHISPDPKIYVGLYGQDVMVSSEIMSAIEKRNTERHVKAKQYVTSFAAKHHIPLDTREALAHHASARFLHLTGTVEQAIAMEGRLSDLIIVSRAEDAASTHDDTAITAALFNTGRPVLMMPKAEGDLPMQWQDKTIALAWDGSLEAARAMWGAMPLLERAEKLHVLTARSHGDTLDLTAEVKLMDYLKAHGLQTEIIAIDRGRQSAGEVVLDKAKELKADLLVMGAYGHSMFREMILGGFTEHMLKRAGLPIILSH